MWRTDPFPGRLGKCDDRGGLQGKSVTDEILGNPRTGTALHGASSQARAQLSPAWPSPAPPQPSLPPDLLRSQAAKQPNSQAATRPAGQPARQPASEPGEGRPVPLDEDLQACDLPNIDPPTPLEGSSVYSQVCAWHDRDDATACGRPAGRTDGRLSGRAAWQTRGRTHARRRAAFESSESEVVRRPRGGGGGRRSCRPRVGRRWGPTGSRCT